jgi:4-hydroxy-2-oxoheptanedioate aldolase
MIPRVRTVEYVRRVVEYVKFPPVGRRGIDGVNADADWGFIELTDYLAQANERTFIVIQIEDPEAVEIVDEIAAIDGVDVLFVGPGDLSLGYGVPGQSRHPKVERAINLVAEACAKHGKAAGTPAIDAEDTRKLLERGYRLFTTSADYRFVRNGLLETKRSFGELGFTFKES